VLASLSSEPGLLGGMGDAAAEETRRTISATCEIKRILMDVFCFEYNSAV
jgi:hypothetical protein